MGHLLAKIPDRLIGHRRWDQRSPYRPRRDSIGAYALVGKHLRQTARKILDRALGRRVGEQDGVRHVRIYGGRVHDSAAGLHVRDRGLRQIEHRMDVHFEGQFPFLVGNVADVLEGGLMGGVVHQDVDAAQLVDGFLYDGPAMLRVLKIAGDEDGFAPFLLDQTFHLGRVVVFA
jgi:hypothetical protein